MSENTGVIRHYSDTLTAHKLHTRMVIEKDKSESFSFDELVEKTKADIDRFKYEIKNYYRQDRSIVDLIMETIDIDVDEESIGAVNMQIALIETLAEKAGWCWGGYEYD